MRGLVESPLLLRLVSLEALNVEDPVVAPRVVEEKAAGRTCRRRDRIDGIQAQMMPMGTSIVLQTPMFV